MSSTLIRFKNGVHRKEDCGQNREGLSSINSVPLSSNFHILNSMSMSCSPNKQASISKIKLGASDTLAYTFAKILEHIDLYDTYTLLLRENTVICNTLESMILSCSMESKIIIIVTPDGNNYTIKSYFKGSRTSISVDKEQKFRKTITSLNAGHSSIYIVYPELTEPYKDLLNSIKKCVWCIPVSSSSVYVSILGRESYDNFAYPWSGSTFCRGYTIGEGQIRIASNRERNAYIGSFAYYEKMISNTKYKDTCPDCYEMKRTAISINKRLKLESSNTEMDTEEYDKRSSIASAASIVALQEMRSIISSYTT